MPDRAFEGHTVHPQHYVTTENWSHYAMDCGLACFWMFNSGDGEQKPYWGYYHGGY